MDQAAQLGNEPSVIYTIVELRHFGIRRSQAYKMLKVGQIPAIRFGRKYLIPKAKFDAWFEAQGQRALDRSLEGKDIAV